MSHPLQQLVEDFPDIGRIAAVMRKLRRDLGPDAINLINEDGIRFRRLEDGTIEVMKAIRKFFDRHGRRRPTKGMPNSFTDADYDSYNIVRPTLEAEEQWAKVFMKFAPFNPGLSFSVSDWHDQIQAIRGWIEGDAQTANLRRSPAFPILIPPMPKKRGDDQYDYGTELETLLPLVGGEYQMAFPGRSFNNYRQGELAGQVMLVAESRQSELQKRRENGVVPALWFPQALQGFSVLADREQMQTLPHPGRLILGGAIEATMAMIGYTKELAFSSNTPLYDLAACQWRGRRGRRALRG